MDKVSPAPVCPCTTADPTLSLAGLVAQRLADHFTEIDLPSPPRGLLALVADEAERGALLALRTYYPDLSRAELARVLGISRPTLLKKLRHHGL